MSYTKQGPFVNGAAPALNATRLNAIDQGIEGAYLRHGTFVKVVAGSDESAAVKAAADYVCDGVADEVQINAALASVGVATISKGGNGGRVILVGRRFVIAAPISVPSQTTLEGGYDTMGTAIRVSGWTLAASANRGMIELATTSTQYVNIRNLSLIGSNVGACGVYISVATGQEWDSFIRISDLFIEGVGQHGVRMENFSGGRTRGNQTSRVRVLNAGLSGFYVNCPDSFYEFCDTGSSGSHGFHVQHSNNRFIACKSWYSDGSGFYFRAGRDNQLSACESQDNLNHGYDVGSKRNSFSACCADSNGYDGVLTSAGTGSGFYVTSPGNNIQGTASEKLEGGRTPHQLYGLHVVGSIRIIASVTTAQNALGPVNAAAAIAAGSIIQVLDQLP